MASTISAATLTVTHTEALTLNGVDRGVTNTLTIASVNEVDHRIVTVDTRAPRTLVTLGDNVVSGTFVKTSVKYIRLTNKDDTNFVTLGLLNGSSEAVFFKLEAGQTMCLYNDDIDINDSAVTVSSLTTYTIINAQADSANVDLEVFVAST